MANQCNESCEEAVWQETVFDNAMTVAKSSRQPLIEKNLLEPCQYPAAFALILARFMPGCACELIFPTNRDTGLLVVSPIGQETMSGDHHNYLVIGIGYV